MRRSLEVLLVILSLSLYATAQYYIAEDEAPKIKVNNIDKIENGYQVTLNVTDDFNEIYKIQISAVDQVYRLVSNTSVTIQFVNLSDEKINISEVMPYCYTDDFTILGLYLSNCEFVEIYIPESESRNINNYSIDTGGGQYNLSKLGFKGQMIGYHTIAKNKKAFEKKFNINTTLEWIGMGLNDKIDKVSLYKNGILVSEFNYLEANSSLSWQFHTSNGSWEQSVPTPKLFNFKSDLFIGNI